MIGSEGVYVCDDMDEDDGCNGKSFLLAGAMVNSIFLFIYGYFLLVGVGYTLSDDIQQAVLSTFHSPLKMAQDVRWDLKESSSSTKLDQDEEEKEIDSSQNQQSNIGGDGIQSEFSTKKEFDRSYLVMGVQAELSSSRITSVVFCVYFPFL